MANQENTGFSMPMFKDFVPEKWRFWIVLLFPIVFQMSDAVFMGLSNYISGDSTLRNNDVLMCGFAGMIGVTMTFPLLFRLKFRFTTRQILLIVSLGMVMSNLICLWTDFMPVLVVVSFLFGAFKLWGTFECMSSVMLKISPHYNFAPFLSVVFCAVFGSIELSGIIGTHICSVLPWQYMNYFAMSLQLLVALTVLLLMKDFRMAPLNRLYGISWMGLVLWSIVLLALTFVFVYGSSLDWFASPYIRYAVGTVFICLAGSLIYMFYYRHPYLQIKAFFYHNLWNMLVIFLIACVMMATESVLHHVFTEEVLHFDALSVANLRWFILLGVLAGSCFSVIGIEKLKLNFKVMTFLSMLCLTLYVLMMFFIVSPHTSYQAFYLPLFLYGMGHVMVFIVLTTYMEGVVPLQHRFQVLAILGFVRIGSGSAFGAALYGHLFHAEMNSNLALLGANVNPSAFTRLPFSSIMENVVTNSMVLSIKDLYALTLVIGVVTLIILLLSHFKNNFRGALPNLSKANKIFGKR